MIASSSGNSFVHKTEGQLILNGSYDIGFTMELALKNLGIVGQFSKEFVVPLELANKVKQFFLKKEKKPLEAKHNQLK